ncbi:GNAT family N-acetyltransferase [Alicyclobacillus sp. SO9]|uniref:GNAT family N-acetyltransferase n=1 Tax=Alicyclobacillus sp. SO9 TaxID=2665646 RepID=UPI0018E7DB77|nr:GNAT family N-acetyltransferase [Alicyclobacillus sp. SO9]QQE79179.1 GNAT family N-acetyltransferase [Alicyclobacillus sp. SO9]
MIRHYRSGDEDGIVSLWNLACPEDPVSMDLFARRVLVDPNFDAEGLLIYEESGNILGFTLCILRKLPLSGLDIEPENGWITAFFVHPDHQRNKMGTQLFAAAEHFFKKRDRKFVLFASYAPNYFVPGIDTQRYPAAHAFLEKQGYKLLYSPAAMDRNLVNYRIPDDVLKLEEVRRQEGYVFEYLTPKYMTQVVEFNDSKFNPDWARAVREAVAQGVPWNRMFVAHKDEKVVGFCMYGAYDGVGERFGPFGVDEELRGTGLGKILLYKCLYDMKAKGLHNAWFLWTGEKSPAGYLYYRAGFAVSRHFDVMRKELK